MGKPRVGVWLIGALGSIAATVVLGALAVRKGRAGATGMVTETGPFRPLALAGIGDLEFGGWEIRDGSLAAAAREPVAAASCLAGDDLRDLGEDLARIEARIRPGIAHNCGEAISRLASFPDPSGRPLPETVAILRGHLQSFKEETGVEEVVVVNLASTEPPLAYEECHESRRALEERIAADDRELVRASTLYAYAAIREGCPYLNFTPSTGALAPAWLELAETLGVPVMGSDGKTGETLVKSALAPMFSIRNLEVLSWEGFNILGNLDGQVLDNPENCRSKIRTKDRVLGKILGYAPHSGVHINFVPSLGDRKTAWDFVHFRGFLGAEMSLQFTWQGFDSLLAAPLVLDMVRLAALAKKRGESGLMPQLACFFKAPLGVEEHRLSAQFEMLLEYVRSRT